MARFPFLPRYLEPPVVFLGLPLSYHLLFSFPTQRLSSIHMISRARTRTQASPPFSPTDNNRDTGESNDLKYPAGNWSFGGDAKQDPDW